MTSNVLSRWDLGAVHPGVYAEGWITPVDAELVPVINPATGDCVTSVQLATRADYERCVATAQRSFLDWRIVPAPVRGEFVRRFALALRERADDLAALVTLEVGKIQAESRGEVQEMIDMADFAVGLSRQLHGLTIASERPLHELLEKWHPLGPIGVISAFNFPVAVWAWNAMLAAVCGDTCVWKPSPLAPLSAIAVQKLATRVLGEMGLPSIFSLCIGDADVGGWMATDERLPLISATGSTNMGRSVAAAVAQRLGRSLLELGGNNAAIVTPSANLDLAIRAVVFAAVGTAGQRCTTLRRLFVHRNLQEEVIRRLVAAYRTLPIGDPTEARTLVGPLIRQQAVAQFRDAIARAVDQGGKLECGGAMLDRPGFFVEPAIVSAEQPLQIMQQETFAPLLYVVPYDDFDQAVAWQNGVSQGLSSAVFTQDFGEAMTFLSPVGSDCGLANVNLGTSGAEIGGAFGGEKATGGGREAGSDCWKAYMRRQTCTLNFGKSLPLAQGIRFEG